LDKHLFIIAGEESGDQHASALLKEIQQLSPHLTVSGLGGKHLEAQGMQNILDLTQLAITGISGVFMHLKAIRQAFKVTKAYLLKNRPDAVILVDYPGFNLRMAKWIKKNIGCPVIYYISPQIWAWKAKRIEIIKQNVDHMAVILPFEKAIYEQAKVSVSYVGHPLRESLLNLPSQEACREQFSWPADETILAVLPGSRKAEIARHMPVIVESLKILKNQARFQNLKLVIPVAKSLSQNDFLPYLKEIPQFELIDGQAQHVVQAADAVVVASGTASLECAILSKPTCIIYKSSWLNYYLATRWMKVKYLGLANLLLNQMVIPELLQVDCNAQELSKMLQALLEKSAWRTSMVSHLQGLKKLLTPSEGAALSQTVCQYIEN
jgi:lipid-A-disaccharide synthase